MGLFSNGSRPTLDSFQAFHPSFFALQPERISHPKIPCYDHTLANSQWESGQEPPLRPWVIVLVSPSRQSREIQVFHLLKMSMVFCCQFNRHIMYRPWFRDTSLFSHFVDFPKSVPRQSLWSTVLQSSTRNRGGGRGWQWNVPNEASFILRL